jgi:hypothetical protein
MREKILVHMSSLQYGDDAAILIYDETVRKFDKVFSELPDIGGDLNPLPRSPIGSVMGLALYLAMEVFEE